jgi:hypothetical protein
LVWAPHSGRPDSFAAAVAGQIDETPCRGADSTLRALWDEHCVACSYPVNFPIHLDQTVTVEPHQQNIHLAVNMTIHNLTIIQNKEIGVEIGSHIGPQRLPDLGRPRHIGEMYDADTLVYAVHNTSAETSSRHTHGAHGYRPGSV